MKGVILCQDDIKKAKAVAGNQWNAGIWDEPARAYWICWSESERRRYREFKSREGENRPEPYRNTSIKISIRKWRVHGSEILSCTWEGSEARSQVPNHVSSSERASNICREQIAEGTHRNPKTIRRIKKSMVFYLKSEERKCGKTRWSKHINIRTYLRENFSQMGQPKMGNGYFLHPHQTEDIVSGYDSVCLW